MNNTQSLLTIGALLLISILSLRFNSVVLSTSNSDIENKIYLTAFSLADDMIEEIKGKSFDQATIEFPTTNTSSLTPSNALGHGSGEVYPNYNDVDDYNGYSKLVSSPYAEDYNISVVVVYVYPDNPDQVSYTQTFDKKVTVIVTSPYLKGAVQLSYICTLK